MKPTETKSSVQEVISLDNYKIILRYTERSVPGVLDNIQSVLFNQSPTPTKIPKICSKTESMR